MSKDLNTLIEQRERRAENDQAIRNALREWGEQVFGTVDAFCVAVAQRKGWTVAHVRNALTYPKSRDVLDEAITLYRERETAEAA